MTLLPSVSHPSVVVSRSSLTYYERAVGILVFVCYVLWGVAPTIHLFRLLKRGVLAIHTRVSSSGRSDRAGRWGRGRGDSVSSSVRSLTANPDSHSIGSASDDSLDAEDRGQLGSGVGLGLGLGLDSGASAFSLSSLARPYNHTEPHITFTQTTASRTT